VSFSNAETMLFKPQYASTRRFQKLSGPNVLLEPKSLQLIQTNTGTVPTNVQDAVKYDTADYSALPLIKRIEGIWEVMGYRYISPHQLPPYGFFNDIWTIDGGKVNLYLQAQQKSGSFSYVLNNKDLVLTNASGQGKSTGLTWSISFDEWGHMQLSSGDGDIVFKLVSKATKGTVELPVKIVLSNRKGDENGF
jgi:hypothetical protein